jgi:hypothetical protein
MRRHAFAFAVIVVSSIAAFTACKTPAPQGSGVLEQTTSCATLEARVKSLQEELAQLSAVPATANADGQAACKDKSGAQWNAAIGRCECVTDPTKFTANAWSIRNTLKCEAAVDSFRACKSKAGARWNAEIGRCECITDPTKFSGNAWSIKNTLKCQAATDAWQACKEVHGAIWNETIGRCECESDPTRFQGNAWSIRTHLTCLGGSAVDDAVKADEFLKSDTQLALTDGFELTRDKETVEKELSEAIAALSSCRQGTTSVPPPPTKGACIFVRKENKQVQETCMPDVDQAGCDRAYETVFLKEAAYEHRLVLGKDCAAAKNEAAAASAGTGVVSGAAAAAAAGASVAAEATGACLLKSKTSAKEYCQSQTKTGCDGWAARNGQKFDLVAFTPGAACGQTASTELASACSCSFSQDGRFCGVWKAGKILTPYYGPLGNGWRCDAQSTKNNLCKNEMLKQLMAGASCR